MLDDEDRDDEEDAESDYGEESLCMLRTSSFEEAFPALCALRTPKKPKSCLTPNPFQALADKESSPDLLVIKGGGFLT